MYLIVRRLMLFLLVALFMYASMVFCIEILLPSSMPRIALRNCGQQPITAIKITLVSREHGQQQVFDVPKLAPKEIFDQAILIAGDPELKIEYICQGIPQKHQNDYIDLWPNDSWLVEIDDNGSCSGHYWTDRPTEAAGE